MSAIAYLLGAGFSLTANTYFEAKDQSLYSRYPLANDLTQQCFDNTYDLASGVEAAFQMACERRDPGPIGTLVKIIQGADMEPGRLAAGDPDSAVRRFLRQMPAKVYLTFNYDCLVEQMLLKEGHWDPRDGFGLDVKASIYTPTGRHLWSAGQRPK